MHEPSYYRARLYLFDKLIEQLPIEEKEKKNTPRQLLKNGYWSPELGDEQEEVIKSRQFDVNGEDPLKLSEITRYSTWFAMHPEKVCGKEVVTSSMFFPVKIEGTDDDVKDTVNAGIRAAKGESTIIQPEPNKAPEPVKKPAPNLLRMRLKAKALKLKFKLAEMHTVFEKPEYVTRQNTDLQKEFDYFNRLCFDDSLQSVPMQWGIKRDKLGAVCYTGYKNQPNSWIIKYLEISLFNKIRYKDFVDTLVHEMIHVFIIQNRMRDTGDHGVLFMKEAERINKMDVGINITVTGDTSGLEVSDEIKRKEFVVALVYQKQKQYGISIYNRALHNDIPRWYDSLPKEFVDKNQFTFKVVVSDIPELLKFKAQNAFNRRSLKTFRVNENTFAELEKSRTLDGIQGEQIKLMIIH